MKKIRGKALRVKKYVSLMMVPHNSDKVKTWRISNIHSKIFTLLAVFMLILLTLSGYLALTIQENRELREQHNGLQTFLLEQQNIVQKRINTIEEVVNLDNVSKDTIKEFSMQIQNLTENYIEKETKTLTVSRSSAASNPTTSFIGKITELRAVLKFLEEADKKGDELFTSLADTKEELRSYLDHLPTFWPTEGLIESPFGNRLHPVYRKFLDHTGVDIGGKSGNPIFASASGTVIYSGTNGGYGYCIDIDHGNGLVTRYAHCSKILVKKWQKVDAGQEIARVGSTGVSTGPHLHFEIRLNDYPIDPAMFIGTKPNN